SRNARVPLGGEWLPLDLEVLMSSRSDRSPSQLLRVVLTLAVALGSEPALAGSLGVNLKRELDEASVVAWVKVLRYEAGMLHMEPLNPRTAPKQARCSPDPSWTLASSSS